LGDKKKSLNKKKKIRMYHRKRFEKKKPRRDKFKMGVEKPTEKEGKGKSNL